MAFKPVSPQVNFPQLEKDIMQYWADKGVVRSYLDKNRKSKTKFSFLDGPITANNPMGVHHAWGRTYKDIWQKYYTMKGRAGRYQNGFDCQGLWVEVEVEKELNFKTKKDIETYGIADFVNRCKERVRKYSDIQTRQSQRLGYFMDWDNSYYTMSDDNNYAIWSFLKACFDRGWIYKGHDVVPWCPRCETAISQHEILTEDYRELTHDSIFLKLPIRDTVSEYLLIWTTTPWTLVANTAVAVDAKIDYSLVESHSGDRLWVAADLIGKVFKTGHRSVIRTVKGRQLVGLSYRTPFDCLPVNAQTLKNHPDKFHVVIATDDLLMPISREEGTGLVHTSTSTGEEDHRLGKQLGLPVIPAIDDAANYLDGFGEFSAQNAKKHPRIIIDYLQKPDGSGENWIFEILPYTHRYPACWRCKSELVWKVADEWYIAMDKPDPTDSRNRSFRQQMTAIVKQIRWLPAFGLERELDWLKNMHDWLISKKNRYWGLALPIYECGHCGSFEVIGSKSELSDRAVSGWDEFSGHSPHKPWIDRVSINCRGCGRPVTRIPDVGNPWLDAGIVSVSTLPADWYPADFITESFPGQFKNWFYSLIAMATVLKKSPPFKHVLGFASLLDDKGEVMHKSSGNMIEFNHGADQIGVDVMRWIFARQNPENNLLFGYKKSDEIRRQFHLILWNIYNFFITYANLDGFRPGQRMHRPSSLLDRWILVRLDQLISSVTAAMNRYDAVAATGRVEEFVSDLSLWYVRRSRDRVGPTATDQQDKIDFYTTLFRVLCDLCRVLAPFMPFITEEIYLNLTGETSVHLASWPSVRRINPAQEKLVLQMKEVRKLVEMALSARKDHQIKVRQPLSRITLKTPDPLPREFLGLLLDEVNIKTADWEPAAEPSVLLDTSLTPELLAEGRLRDLIRQVQELRKQAGIGMDKQIILSAPIPSSPEMMDMLKRKTMSLEIRNSDTVSIAGVIS